MSGAHEHYKHKASLHLSTQTPDQASHKVMLIAVPYRVMWTDVDMIWLPNNFFLPFRQLVSMSYFLWSNNYINKGSNTTAWVNQAPKPLYQTRSYFIMCTVTDRMISYITFPGRYNYNIIMTCPMVVLGCIQWLLFMNMQYHFKSGHIDFAYCYL